MNAALALKRVAVGGMIAVALTIGGLFMQPVATASASVLPSSHAGAPDIGYPTCTGTHCNLGLNAAPPSSGDIGYPTCTGTRCQSGVNASPPSSGDIGYPTCQGSHCFQAQPDETTTVPDREAIE